MITQSATLSEVCLAIVDCEHKTVPVDSTGAFYAVGTAAMRDNRIDYSNAKPISEETFLVWTRRLTPEPGDLLLAREAPVGPVVEIPVSANVAPGQRTVLMRADPSKVDPTFLKFTLRSPLIQSRLIELAEGSTVPHLNVAEIRNFQLPTLPDLEEQRGIGRALESLEARIANIVRSRVAVRRLISAVYSLYALRSSEGLSSFGEFVSERRERIGVERSDEATVLSAVAVGELRPSADFFNKRVHSKSIEKYLAVPLGALAYNPSRANIGSIGINDAIELGAVSPVYVVADVAPEWRRWVQASLRTPQVTEQIMSLSSGSVRQNLRFSDFASIEIPRPSSGDLASFNELWEHLAGHIKRLDHLDQVLVKTREALATGLFNGVLSIHQKRGQAEVVE